MVLFSIVDLELFPEIVSSQHSFLLTLSEMRMLREQETAMNKLKERKARFEAKLNETQRVVTEFKNRERMSDAPQYVDVMDQLKKRVEEFIVEVICFTSEDNLSSCLYGFYTICNKDRSCVVFRDRGAVNVCNTETESDGIV